MRKLIIPIPNFDNTEKTYLDADYSSGTALTVVNNYGFADNDIAVIGEPGEEKTESKDVSGQTGDTQIDISAALKFDHNKGCVVYRYEYDQYQIYRYRSAAWTLISTSNIQWDKRETIYVDSDGLSTDSYRFRLKNSASLSTSDYSPTIAATGFTRSMVGYMIRNVRKISGDTERKIVTDDELIRQFNGAQDIIRGFRTDWWFLRKESSGDITTVANTRKYGLNTYLSDMNYIDTVRYNYTDGTVDEVYQIKFKPLVEWDALVRDNDAENDDRPEFYTIQPPDSTDETGYIELDKTSETTGYGAFYIRYFKTMADLDDVADETDVPIPSILEDYALEYIYRVKGDNARADVYKERFWGPHPGREEKYREPTGLRLLDIMQRNKGKPVGEPKQLKKFIGRRPITRLFQEQTVNRDDRAERYF
jgi:hypothetical protein